MNVKAVVFDWTGTMIDHGSLAPMGAFVKVFSDFGVVVTVDEARRPMGMPKRDHKKALLTKPEISERWSTAHGQPPTDSDVDRVFDVFVPLNESIVTDFADLIPGVLECHAALRERGIKIGSTTGYIRSIMK
jgi:phosphonoacetaldehyde hydrolase